MPRLGYAVFAVDMFGYGEGVLPKTVPEMTAQIVNYYKDRPLMKARARAGLEAMLKNPMIDASRVALIGYCFGGTVGIEMAYAGAPLAATITIHGTFRDHVSEDAKNVKGKALILHGAEDQVSPLARSTRSSPTCARPRSTSTTSSTAAPTTASRRRRTRPRSAPTCSRSRRRRAT